MGAPVEPSYGVHDDACHWDYQFRRIVCLRNTAGESLILPLMPLELPASGSWLQARVSPLDTEIFTSLISRGCTTTRKLEADVGKRISLDTSASDLNVFGGPEAEMQNEPSFGTIFF